VLSENAKALIEQQRQKYIKSLPAKRDRIAECWSRSRATGADAVDRQSLLLQIHRIAGSAGIYGFDGLARIAFETDQMLYSCNLEEALPEKLCSLMDQIISEFNLVIQQHETNLWGQSKVPE
jgi:hypothetical protein